MLSHAIAEQYGVAPPTRSSGGESDRIIGNPRWPRNRQVPWIGSSHTIPSIAFAWRWFNWLLPHPPVVVLVRDINAAMQSNYIKWRDRYGGTISAYVRGDPNGRRYVADIWWYMHFFNRWGKLARAQGDNVLVVRYEELLTAPAQWLRRIASHYNITLEEPAITAALQHVDRDAIRERLDPGDEAIVVPSSGIAAALSFVPEDIAFIRVAMQRHLRWDFGYGYTLPGGV